MSTITRSLLLLALLVTGALLAACSSSSPGGSLAPTAVPPTPPTASPSTPAATGDVSITIQTQGGHCIQGSCNSTVMIASDGTVRQSKPQTADLGTVSEATLEALMTEVEQADFDAIRSQPFTDTCPIAFDGQQFIYTFTLGSQVETIDSCQVVVDPANPLFVAVNAALAEVAPR